LAYLLGRSVQFLQQNQHWPNSEIGNIQRQKSYWSIAIGKKNTAFLWLSPMMDNNQGDESLLLPQEESPAQHHQQQNPLQHQGMQQHAFIGFGIDPNWGGFGQMMHGQPG